ncbi:hypothetical protein DB346_10160 [Verrucomicrobia bacterium LW23]|nr:hypothetical protein DB346_10160 [Verrucomicrobia bacterium LW23]
MKYPLATIILVCLLATFPHSAHCQESDNGVIQAPQPNNLAVRPKPSKEYLVLEEMVTKNASTEDAAVFTQRLDQLIELMPTVYVPEQEGNNGCVTNMTIALTQLQSNFQARSAVRTTESTRKLATLLTWHYLFLIGQTANFKRLPVDYPSSIPGGRSPVNGGSSATIKDPDVRKKYEEAIQLAKRNRRANYYFETCARNLKRFEKHIVNFITTTPGLDKTLEPESFKKLGNLPPVPASVKDVSPF